MTYWAINSLLSLVVSIFLARLIMPKILFVSFKKKLFDSNDERKVHNGIVPRLGGVAFKPVIFFSVALLLGGNSMLDYNEFLYNIGCEVKPLAFSYCVIMLLYMIGLIDDLVGMRYRQKFLVQLICAFLLVAGGISLNNFGGLFALGELPEFVSYSFSVLLIIFFINAINLIDGIDGLASGLAMVALSIYGTAFMLLGMYVYSIISFATMGVLVVFFRYNVFGSAEKEQKIFMGDAGSLTIGVLLTVLSVRLSQVWELASSSVQYGNAELSPLSDIIITHSAVVAFVPMFLPCFDVVRVFCHRIQNRQNPFNPDKSHIHHKLLAAGMSQQTAMVTIVAIDIAFILFNIIMMNFMNINILFLIDTAFWICFNIYLSRRMRANRQLKQANT